MVMDIQKMQRKVRNGGKGFFEQGPGFFYNGE